MSGAAETVATLPDDVLLEILVRLTDVAALFRCATACKRWSILIADPSFLLRRWPKDACHPSSLLGFFTSRWRRYSAIEGYAVESVFLPATASALGPGRRFMGSFFTDPLFDRALPLTSRGGLLLVRLDRPSAPNRCPSQQQKEIQLAVCDPLAGTCEVLPLLKCNNTFFDYYYCGGSSWSCAILTGGDGCSSSQRQPLPAARRRSSDFFKVLMVSAEVEWNELQTQYNLRMFSSGQPTWSAKCFNAADGLVMVPHPGVVCRDTAHWLFCKDKTSNFYILNVNVETSHISWTKLMAPLDLSTESYLWDANRLTTTPDGTRLSLCLCVKGLQVEMWASQQDDEEIGDANWLLSSVIELKRNDHEDIGHVLCLCVGEGSGTLLIYDDRGPALYVAHLKTGAVEKLANDFNCSGGSVAPFEIDWPAFFTSRLARLA